MEGKTKTYLWKLIDDTKEDLIRLLSDLIQRPSVNPPIEATEIIRFITEYFTRWDIPYEITGPSDKYPIVVASLEHGSGFSLCFNGHSDVVDPGDIKKWSYNPFCGEITENYVLGRGASDMLGGLAVDMHLMRLIQENQIPFSGKITLHIVPDEESGGEYGTKWLTKSGYCKNINAVVLGEPTGPDNIETGARGGVWAKFTAHGTQAHGSVASFVGSNATTKMCRFFGELDQFREIAAFPPDSQAQVMKNSKKVAIDYFGVPAVEKVLDHVTYNISSFVSTAEGKGEGEYCESMIHMRIPNGVTAAGVYEKVQDLARKHDISLSSVRLLEPGYTVFDSDLVQSALDNASQIWERNVLPVYQWASSDGLYYRHLGIPTIQCGPSGDGIHGYDERASIYEIIGVAKIHAGIAADLLKM